MGEISFVPQSVLPPVDVTFQWHFRFKISSGQCSRWIPFHAFVDL